MNATIFSAPAGATSTLNLPVTLVGSPNYTFTQGNNSDVASEGDLLLTRVPDAGYTANIAAYHTLGLLGALNATMAYKSAYDKREWSAFGWDYEPYIGALPCVFWEVSIADPPTPPLSGGISAAQSSKSGTVTISNASPAVVSWTSHGLAVGTPIVLTSTGALPAPLANGTAIYFIIASGYGTNSFEISITPGGAAINTTSAGSGTHTASSPIVLTSDTPYALTPPYENQSWPTGAILPILISGLTATPSSINGVHWCVSIDSTHFWINPNDSVGTISGVSGAAWTTTSTAPAMQRFHSTDHNGQTAYGAYLIESVNQDGSYVLNDRTGENQVIGYDAPGTTLTLGNATSMTGVNFQSPIRMSSGQVIYLNTLQTGISNPGILFAQGGGLSTSNGGDISIVVETNNVSTNTAITKGSVTATVSSASGISNGMSVIGPGIHPGTTVTISGTTVTLSTAATITNAAQPLTYFTPFGALTADNSGNVTIPNALNVGSLSTPSITLAGSSPGMTLHNTGAANDAQYFWNPQSDGTILLQYFDTVLNTYQTVLSINGSTGKVTISLGKLNLAGIPTSSSGLVSGDVWSNLGILTIV